MSKPAPSSRSAAKPAESPASPDGMPAPEFELANSSTVGSTPKRRRRVNRRLLVPLLGLLVIVGVVSALVLPQFFASNSNETIWQSITSGITDGTVPKQVALEAFAYDYKVNIPGVTVPGGRDGGDAPTSGSGVMRWVKANWDALTADQQAVINRYLTPGPNDRVLTPSPAPTVAPSKAITPSVHGANSGAQLMDARQPAPPVNLAPGSPISPLEHAMIQELANDLYRIGPKLGMPVIQPHGGILPPISLRLSRADGGNVLFLTDAKANDLGDYSPCTMTAYKAAWENEQVTASGGVSPRLHVLMTHEVIHCYQNVIWGSVSTQKAIGPWITEGTAIYLAADDTGIAEPTLPGAWQDGYFTPEIALTNRTYDAVGYYALLAHQGRDMWKLMVPAWQAAAAPGARSNAFIAVLQGDAPDIRDNWAESYLRQSAWGDPWIAYGFGLPDAAQVYQHPAQAQASPGWTGSLLGRSNTILNVNATSGEVVTVTTDGLASVHDSRTPGGRRPLIPVANAILPFVPAGRASVAPAGAASPASRRVV